jgi:hypothetical protein
MSLIKMRGTAKADELHAALEHQTHVKLAAP